MKQSDRVKPSAALIVAFTALVVSLAGNAGAFNGITRTSTAPNVKVVVATSSVFHPGDAGGKLAVCPGGYSVFGGAFDVLGGSRAVPFLVGPLRKRNAYEVDISNPPANPSAGLPGADAEIEVAAWCARTGQPIVLPHFGS